MHTLYNDVWLVRATSRHADIFYWISAGYGWALVDVQMKCWECNTFFVLSAVLADLVCLIEFFFSFYLHSQVCKHIITLYIELNLQVLGPTGDWQIVAVAHVHIWAPGQVLWIRAQLLACGPLLPMVWGRWRCWWGEGTSDQRDAGTFP